MLKNQGLSQIEKEVLSELTDDDIIIRYGNGKIIGLTILNASKRKIMTAEEPHLSC